MCRGRIIREAADLPLLVIQQPADTLLRWVPLNLWSILVRHLHRPDLRLVIAPLLINQRLMHRITNELTACFARGV